MNNKGFTLIEAILVLSIVIMIASISLLQLRPLNEARKIDHFLEQLQNDIFYTQQYAISNSVSTKLYFKAYESFYRMNNGESNEAVFVRTFDPSIQIQYSTLGMTLVFNSKGNIQRAGEIRFKYMGSTYVITFLIGKGRFYVSKK